MARTIGDLGIYVGTMPGRNFNEVEKELSDNGFSRDKTFRERPTGNTRVRLVRGHHECADIISAVFDWDIDHYGIGKPGKVVSAELIHEGTKEFL